MGEPKVVKGEVIIFKHRNFRGHHRHIINEEPNLNHSEDQTLNDQVSSFVVVKGIWKFYRHKNYQIPYDSDLYPGAYSWVQDFGIQNDDMSSLKCIREK